MSQSSEKPAPSLGVQALGAAGSSGVPMVEIDELYCYYFFINIPFFSILSAVKTIMSFMAHPVCGMGSLLSVKHHQHQGTAEENSHFPASSEGQ